MKKIDGSPLAIDATSETRRVAQHMRESAARLKRRGAVVALSGGVDSSVCLGLAVRAFGPGRVLGLILPERESSPASRRLGLEVARTFGVPIREHDITAALEGLDCYADRDAAIRAVFPGYGPGWKNKIAIAGGLEGGFNFFKLVVQDPSGNLFSRRLPHEQFLQVVAAQNHKQRVRKAVEYHHADRLNYAVVGTPNRLEYELGFFVKNGDGSADLKPIAHLFKSQVYDLAAYLGVPEEIRRSAPTTDTYTMPQGQDEFFYGLPYHQTDLALWCLDNGVPESAAAGLIGVPPAQAGALYRDLEAKRAAAAYLHAVPAVMEPVRSSAASA